MNKREKLTRAWEQFANADDKVIDLSATRKKLDATAKTISDWGKNSPDFARLCFEDEDVRVKLKQLNNWSNLFMHHTPPSIHRPPPSQFFRSSLTHLVMFHELAKNQTDRIFSEDHRLPADSIGTPLVDLVHVMEVCGENKRRNTIIKYIQTGVQKGYLHETTSRYDKRVKVIYLDDKVLTNWLEVCGPRLFNNVNRQKNPRTNLDLIEKTRDPNWDDATIEKMRDAIESDDRRQQ